MRDIKMLGCAVAHPPVLHESWPAGGLLATVAAAGEGLHITQVSLKPVEFQGA